MNSVIVLGAGVSGLTTAVRLMEAGYEVRILTKELPEQTTSAVAAAIWFPYEAEPVALANRWSAESFYEFRKLAEQAGTGVSMMDFLVLSQPGRSDSWKDELPKEDVRLARPEELPEGYELGYMARVPLAETQIYLHFLQERFQQLGGSISVEEVTNVDDWLKEGQAIVNCTGLGSRQLFSDESVYPIRGQVVKVEKKGPVQSMVDSIHKGKLGYIIERSDCIVLGGTDYDNDYSLNPRQEDTRKILAICQSLDPRVTDPEILQAAVGLRPKRPAIRCEKEPGRRVIHNYGHGGAGFTVSWGCANEVLKIMKNTSAAQE